MRTLLISGALLGITLTAGGAQEVDLDPYLPAKETVTAGIFEVGAPPEIQALSEKMAAALRKEAEWLKEYLAANNLGPGEVLPYHEKLGVSKKEYQALVAAAGDVRLNKVGEAKLTFQKTDDRLLITFAGNERLPLKRAKIMTEADVVHTERMTLKERIAIDQDDPSSPTGRWEGVQWRYLQGKTLETRFGEKFAIGRLKDKEEGIIYYDLRAADRHGASMILLYDLK